MSKKFIPAISVVIPMYNAEKYIGECIESILAQTFKDFEIIVVDDCSTDNSCAVVEKYILGGGGVNIKLIRRKKNSGCPGIPRNRGLEISRGKYIFFMDNDDLFTKTALEELFNLAENFQAEVVCCDRVGTFQDIKNISVENKPYFVKVPEFLPEDLPTRISLQSQFRFRPEPWLKFTLRSFLIENEIKFEKFIAEDSIWTIQLLISAKKFLMIPNVCYLYRDYPESLSKLTHTASNEDNSHKILRKLNRTVCGIKKVDNFMNRIEFFKNHPEWRYALLSHVLNSDLNWALQDVANVPPHVIYETFKNGYQKDFDEYDVLFSTLITNNMMFMKNLIIAQQKK